MQHSASNNNRAFEKEVLPLNERTKNIEIQAK